MTAAAQRPLLPGGQPRAVASAQARGGGRPRLWVLRCRGDCGCRCWTCRPASAPTLQTAPAGLLAGVAGVLAVAGVGAVAGPRLWHVGRPMRVHEGVRAQAGPMATAPLLVPRQALRLFVFVRWWPRLVVVLLLCWVWKQVGQAGRSRAHVRA